VCVRAKIGRRRENELGVYLYIDTNLSRTLFSRELYMMQIRDELFSVKNSVKYESVTNSLHSRTLYDANPSRTLFSQELCKIRNCHELLSVRTLCMKLSRSPRTLHVKASRTLCVKKLQNLHMNGSQTLFTQSRTIYDMN